MGCGQLQQHGLSQQDVDTRTNFRFPSCPAIGRGGRSSAGTTGRLPPVFRAILFVSVSVLLLLLFWFIIKHRCLCLL